MTLDRYVHLFDDGLEAVATALDRWAMQTHVANCCHKAPSRGDSNSGNEKTPGQTRGLSP
jgi:hypothetical protein